LSSSDNNSPDFVINRFLETVTYRRVQFTFDLPRTVLKKEVKWCFCSKI